MTRVATQPAFTGWNLARHGQSREGIFAYPQISGTSYTYVLAAFQKAETPFRIHFSEVGENVHHRDLSYTPELLPALIVGRCSFFDDLSVSGRGDAHSSSLKTAQRLHVVWQRQLDKKTREIVSHQLMLPYGTFQHCMTARFQRSNVRDRIGWVCAPC
jgi:hypothetical protein